MVTYLEEPLKCDLIELIKYFLGYLHSKIIFKAD